MLFEPCSQVGLACWWLLRDEQVRHQAHNFLTSDQQMIHKMEQAGTLNEDTLYLVKNIAGLVLTNVEDKKRLAERFKNMLDDILKESWVYKETIEEGKEEGRKVGKEEAKKEDVIQFVEIRFPMLLAQAKQAIERQTSVQQLQVILNKLYRANTIEEAQAALLANG